MLLKKILEKVKILLKKILKKAKMFLKKIKKNAKNSKVFKTFKSFLQILNRGIFILMLRNRYFFLIKNFLKITPNQCYWVAQRLLNMGYLDFAYEIIKDTKNLKRYQIPIKKRMESMLYIDESILNVKTQLSVTIESIQPLFVAHNSFPFDRAGYAIRTHMLTTNLKKNGLTSSVATRAGYPWDLLKHRGLDGERKTVEAIDGINYIRLPDNNKFFKKGDDLDYINAYASELIKVAKQNKNTIIHASSNYLNGFAAFKAGKELNIPTVYEIRGLWHLTRLTLDKEYKKSSMFLYEQEMEKSVAKAVYKVVTISYALKKLIESWGIDANKIHVIPNAVDSKLFIPRVADLELVKKYNLQNKIVIGFVGSLTGYEGLRELILAVKELVKSGLEIVLIIVGDGKERVKLEKLAKSKNIIFTGRVPFSEVQKYYSVFHICPLPRNDYEVCRYVPPLKILEAMAMKKAVIVSDVDPLLEIVKDGVTGLVCKADDKESLKESIKSLYDNEALRMTLANNAYDWVHKYRSWSRISKKYNDLYKQFL